MLFAEKIKKLRKKLDLSQSHFAVMLGVSQSSVACWETGITECSPPVRERLKKVCDINHIRISWRK